MYVCIYIYICWRVLLQGAIFDIGQFGLVVTSANLGGRDIFRRNKAGSKRKKDVKIPFSDSRFFRTERLGLQSREDA